MLPSSTDPLELIKPEHAIELARLVELLHRVVEHPGAWHLVEFQFKRAAGGFKPHYANGIRAMQAKLLEPWSAEPEPAADEPRDALLIREDDVYYRLMSLLPGTRVAPSALLDVPFGHELARLIAPFVTRAMRGRQAHVRRTASEGALRSCFDHLPSAAIAISRSGSVIASNERARGEGHVADGALALALRDAIAPILGAPRASEDRWLPTRQYTTENGAAFTVAALQLGHADAIHLYIEPRYDLDAKAAPWLARLTPAEARVARKILDGRSNEEIAHELHISLQTVKTHARTGFEKLGVSGRVDLLSRILRGDLPDV